MHILLPSLAILFIYLSLSFVYIKLFKEISFCFRLPSCHVRLGVEQSTVSPLYFDNRNRVRRVIVVSTIVSSRRVSFP